MTDEIFRRDAYAKECEARVASASAAGIVLDQTVFYPEGGGQPGDTGTLVLGNGAEIPILDTRKEGDRLLHLPAECAPLPETGERVTARIDWERRYRHMRTHTCLHLLCAVIPHPVTGGSIGVEKGRLDFDMSEPLDKAAAQAALDALVAADTPVACRWITDEEMEANMDLVRTMSVRPPSGQGQVRLVDVDGVDLQPCGGTHVARTGEIGKVRIGKVEKKGRQNRRVNVVLD